MHGGFAHEDMIDAVVEFHDDCVYATESFVLVGHMYGVQANGT